MDITKIRIIGLSTVDLPIIGALPSDSYILKAADGLGPPESDVSIASSLEQWGRLSGTSDSQSRNCVSGWAQRKL